MKAEVTICDYCKEKFEDPYDVKGSITFNGISTNSLSCFKQHGRIGKDRESDCTQIGVLDPDSFFCCEACLVGFFSGSKK